MSISSFGIDLVHSPWTPDDEQCLSAFRAFTVFVHTHSSKKSGIEKRATEQNINNDIAGLLLAASAESAGAQLLLCPYTVKTLFYFTSVSAGTY